MALTIKHTSAPLGHELVGIDLKTIDERTFKELDDTYKECGPSIVVRGQNLSPRELVDFSGRFGKLLVYPLGDYLLEGFPEIFVVSNIIENGKPIGMKEAGSNWHSDMFLHQRPLRGGRSCMRWKCLFRTARRSATRCLQAARRRTDDLSAEMKEKIDGLYAVNSASHHAKKRMERSGKDDPELRARFERQAREFPDIVHPLVRKHPLTGRKSLYLRGDQTVCRSSVGRADLRMRFWTN